MFCTLLHAGLVFSSLIFILNKLTLNLLLPFLEMSHRSADFAKIVNGAESDLRELL